MLSLTLYTPPSLDFNLLKVNNDCSFLVKAPQIETERELESEAHSREESEKGNGLVSVGVR